MKVTVSFNTIKIVVPCGDGEKTVRELTQLATIRYKKATGKPRLSWVSVHSLKAKEGGILDPDDRLVDVCDDREQLIAFYDEEGIPQCGDGMSASSDESETTSGSYNKNDIEVSSGEYGGAPPLQLQVRRGSEPALNKLDGQQQQGGVGFVEQETKRWSAAVLMNRDANTKSSKTDLSVINEAASAFYGDANFDFDPGGGRYSPLPPPFERGQGSGAARDSDRPNPFSRDANRLSIQIGHEDGRWLEAADRTAGDQQNRGFEPPPPSSQAIEADFGVMSDNSSGPQRLRREPLGGTSPPRASSEELTRIVIQNEIGPLGIHVVPSGDPAAAGLLIQGIEPGGRIDRDGRLAVHDRIVEINGYSLTDIPFHKAQEIFKEALFTKELSLVVEKNSATELSPDAFNSEMFNAEENKENEGEAGGTLGRRMGSTGPGSKAASSVQAANTRKIGKKLHVTLVKGVHGLGFSITTRDIQAGGVTPIYIKNILPKGAAIENGQLRPGDRLLEVNSECMDGRSQGEVVAILRNTPQNGEVSLVVSRQERVEEIEASTLDRRVKERNSGRDTPSRVESKENSTPNTEESEEYTSISPDVSVNSNGDVVFPWKHREILTLDIPVHDTERAGLGVSVKGKTTGGGNKSIVDLGIFVKSVIHGGAASRDGRLKTNDQLVNINGISLLGKANCDAMNTLRQAMHEEGPTPGVITLTVARRLLVAPSELGNKAKITGRDSVTSILTSSSGEDSFREYRIGANNTTNSFDNTQNDTVIYVEKPNKKTSGAPAFDNFLAPSVPRNPVVDRLMGGAGGRRTKEQQGDGLRNESYYRATGHDTWNATMIQRMDSPDTPDHSRHQLKSPTVHMASGETVMIEQFERPHSPDGAERCKLSDSDVTVSQISLQEEDVPGFARDQPGRRSMSEKRHATLDAKSTDTYQRSKKARQEREQAALESGEVGPTLGMKKSSSLESLQTMMTEMKLETARPPATRSKGSRVVRGRGCNESFRAAVDRSYEAQDSEDQPDPEIMETFDRAEYRQSGSSLDSNNADMKKKKNGKMFKGFGMFKFGKQRAKSSDSGRLSAQERKTPTTELTYGSRATPLGELEEAHYRQEEAQARMVAEQARIQQHYRRLVQQRQETEASSHSEAGSLALCDEVYSGEAGRQHESALPASLAAARPGSRSGITGTQPDQRFANYEEIQRHLSRRQAQYHSQRREHPARSERPVSNFYEYESVQSNISHGRQLSQGSSGSGSQLHHQSGLPNYRTVSPPRQDMPPPPRRDPPPSHYSHRTEGPPPPPYSRPRDPSHGLGPGMVPPSLSVAPLPSQYNQFQGRGDYEDTGRLHSAPHTQHQPPPHTQQHPNQHNQQHSAPHNQPHAPHNQQHPANHTQYEDPYGRVVFRGGNTQHVPAHRRASQSQQSQLLQQRNQSHIQVPNNLFLPSLPPGSKV